MRKKVKGKSSKAFLDITDLPYYDEMTSDPNYFARSKALRFKIKKLRPEDYFKECAKIHGLPVEREYEAISSKRLSSYTERAKQGSQMPMPVLDYTKAGGQEGRHRVVVAKRLGKKTVPVFTVNRMEEKDHWNWLLSNEPKSMEAIFGVPKEYREQFFRKRKGAK